MKYRKRPVVIDAVQWTGTNADAVLGFTLGRASVRDASFTRLGSSERVLVIETLEGEMRAEPGDWIICGVKGEFYPCKPDIFALTYEADDLAACLAAEGEPAAEPADWIQIQAGAELARLVELVRFTPGHTSGYRHSPCDSHHMLWQWFLKWRLAAEGEEKPQGWQPDALTATHLARAMRKALPPALLDDVIAHLDPLTPFLACLREPPVASPASPEGE